MSTLITQTYKLNLIPGQHIVVVNCAAYDNNPRLIRFDMYNGDNPVDISGWSARVEGTRQGTGEGFSATCSVSGTSRVSFALTNAMTATSGKHPSVIVFYDGTTRVASATFILNVSPAALDEGVPATEEDNTVYQQWLAANTGLIQQNTNDIAVLSARMDTFARLPEGSTTGDAELIDIRVGADGQTYPSAGDAVRGQVHDLKSAFDNFVYGTDEHFVVEGGKINKFKLSLLEGQTYTVTNNCGVNVSVILYKADGTSKTITTQLANGASISFEPDAADYTQIGGWINANPTGTFDAVGGIDSLNILNTVDELNDNVDTITEIKNVNIPVTDYTETTGEFFAGDTGVSATGWAWYKFPVSIGESYTIHTAAGYSARAWVLLNSSNTTISYDQYNGATKVDNWVYSIANANAAYLIVNCDTRLTTVSINKNITNFLALDNSRIIVDGKDLDETVDELRNAIPSDAPIGNILYGKTLVCCGDSITYGADMTGEELVTPTIESYQYSAYTKKWTRWTASEPAAYGYQIAARNGMIFYNGGVSGACVQGSGGTSTVPGFSVADGEYTLLPEDIDYLTLFFGWNDTAFGSLGTISDTTNDSYYGGYNVVLPYLINKYPYTKIALIVPFGTDVGHRQAIRDLANKWGLACFDMMHGGTPLYYNKEPDVLVDQSIITSNRAKFQANGAHPNIHGHYQISTMLEAFLRGI